MQRQRAKAPPDPPRGLCHSTCARPAQLIRENDALRSQLGKLKEIDTSPAALAALPVELLAEYVANATALVEQLQQKRPPGTTTARRGAAAPTPGARRVEVDSTGRARQQQRGPQHAAGSARRPYG